MDEVNIDQQKVQIKSMNLLAQEEKQCRLQYEQAALLFPEPVHLQLIQCSQRSITQSSTL
jgi:hypothetical protein